jgi:hypothetical protein
MYPVNWSPTVAGLLRAERRALGTRTGTRALTCRFQAMLVLAWYRKREDLTVLAAGFGVSRATAYRYRDEVVKVLHAAAPDLHEACNGVCDDGWSHVILDGKVFTTDRCALSGSRTRLSGLTCGFRLHVRIR